jgi:hypothetical protein
LPPASEIPSLNNTLHTTLMHDTIQPQVLPIPSTAPGIGAICNSEAMLAEHMPTTLMFDKANDFLDESDDDIDQDDDENTTYKVSSFIKDFMEANPDPEVLPNERVQFPRKAVYSKVSKATRNALTQAKHAKKARFMAALECIYEKIKEEVAQVAKDFDMKEDTVLKKLQYDSWWSSKKRRVNLWNAIVHTCSVIEKSITTYLEVRGHYN